MRNLAQNPILSKIPFYREKPSKVWGKSHFHFLLRFSQHFSFSCQNSGKSKFWNLNFENDYRLIKNPAPVFQWKHYSMKFRLCHKHSQRHSKGWIWDFNEDFNEISMKNFNEISMKISMRFQWRFQWDFNEEFQQKLKQNPIFKNYEFFWPKIPFYRKSHFTWRNLVRFGKPIIPFYRDPILSGMYCRTDSIQYLIGNIQ